MKHLFLSLFTCLSVWMSAQDASMSAPYIEVSGTSEMDVVPDELFITITLMERMEGKEKITIDKQEADLKKNLKELGVDLANLTLNNANADYRTVRRKDKDVMISKSYVLKVTNTDALSKVYERLDKMNAFDAYISKYTCSKIQEFQKENRIKAIKAAQDKAAYLLAAIGQQAGQPVQITETENYVEDGQGGYRPMRDKMMLSNTAMAYSSGDAEESISFRKIKIRASFQAKFAIQKK